MSQLEEGCIDNMSEDNKIVVPYVAYEGAQVRNERIIKRLIVVLTITILMFFASNLLWLRAWMSYDYVTEDNSELVTIDGGTRGVANYVGNDGSIVNGEDYSKQTLAESIPY